MSPSEIRNRRKRSRPGLASVARQHIGMPPQGASVYRRLSTMTITQALSRSSRSRYRSRSQPGSKAPGGSISAAGAETEPPHSLTATSRHRSATPLRTCRPRSEHSTLEPAIRSVSVACWIDRTMSTKRALERALHRQGAVHQCSPLFRLIPMRASDLSEVRVRLSRFALWIPGGCVFILSLICAKSGTVNP